MVRGLGVRRLLAKFLVLHCMHGDAVAPSAALENEASAIWICYQSLRDMRRITAEFRRVLR